MKISCTIASTVLLSTVMTVVGTTPASAAYTDCPSGSMCLWSQPNHTGQMVRISATSSYRAVSLGSVGSYYNHRGQRTWLHEKADGSGATLCLAPGARKASGLSGWQDNAKAVWLATVASC